MILKKFWIRERNFLFLQWEVAHTRHIRLVTVFLLLGNNHVQKKIGLRTYKRLGLKRIAPFTFCRRIEVGPSLAERVEIRRQTEEALRQAQALGVPMYVQYISSQ